MAFEQLEAALLQLKRERLKKEATERRKQSADIAAIKRFSLSDKIRNNFPYFHQSHNTLK